PVDARPAAHGDPGRAHRRARGRPDRAGAGADPHAARAGARRGRDQPQPERRLPGRRPDHRPAAGPQGGHARRRQDQLRRGGRGHHRLQGGGGRRRGGVPRHRRDRRDGAMTVSDVDPRLLADEPGLAGAWAGLRRRLAQGELGNLPVIVGLALIWLIFTLANDNFLHPGNLTNLVLQIAPIGTISVGVVLVLLLGEIDLSVGAVSGLAAGIMAVLNVKQGWPGWAAIVAGLVSGAAIGLVQGFWTTRFRIPAFVVTLAGLLAWTGALLLVLGETGTVNI